MNARMIVPACMLGLSLSVDAKDTKSKFQNKRAALQPLFCFTIHFIN
jgi:hypothetical protein